MLLKNLFKKLKPEIGKIGIGGISFDTRKIKKGDLFVSIKGNKFNGNDYIKEAISKGAKVIIYSKKIKKVKKVVFIKVNDTRETLARLSAKYYSSKPKNIIAVTGTNGKTSISDFFHQIFVLQNKKVAFLGTLGLKKNKILKKRNLTTFDSLSLNKDLSDIKKNGTNNVIIEASSHGLKQKRLNSLNIKAGIFTNLSHDHLDYHKTMTDYFNSKLILFKKILKKNSFLITDTDIKEFKTLKKIKKKQRLKIYTIGSKSNLFKILSHKIYKDHQLINIAYKQKVYKLKINLYGTIQIKNLLMAVLAAKVCGLKINNIFNKIEKIKSVEGRLELIRTLPNKSKIFLDYAHTPDALQNAILSLRQHYKKKITLIFGCGGDRDKSKRKPMGMIANKHCDRIFITDDNPRSENPKKIRKQIMSGLKNSNAIEISNRKRAIINALKNSNSHEIILISGKGHETYQELGNKKIFLSDRHIIKNFKPSKKLYNQKKNILNYNSKILKKILGNEKKYSFDGVSINSKKVKYKNLFIAIKGKKNDGHNFLKQAINNKAEYCVVSKKFKNGRKLIKVKNTMLFLNKLAQSIRAHSSAKFIAITGSSGKTSVKTMTGNLLKEYSNTYFSPNSYNNQYGVPLSICNMKMNDNFGVFEVGMNKFNEIYKLSALVKPHIATITNISEAHLENFKNIRDIAKAKSEIIYNVQKEGTVILNRDDRFFNYFKKIADRKKVTVCSFGYSKKSNIKYLSIKKIHKEFVLKVSVYNKIFHFKISNDNRSFIMNILNCIAILQDLNLNLNKAKYFFKNQKFLKGRGKINKVKNFNKSFYLIDESYNANPLSVKSAIENFSKIKKNGKRKYFLFGDMLELGKNSSMYHKNISKIINKSDIDKTFVYGEKSSETYKLLKKNKKGEVLKNLNSFDQKISMILKNGDYLLIKGSNATNLHKVSNRFLRRSANAL